MSRTSSALPTRCLGVWPPVASSCTADITVAPDTGLERSFLDEWVGFMRHAGLEEERIPHVLADHREHDMAESTSAQLSFLRAAGFAPAEVIWSWEKFVLFYAAKPISAAGPRVLHHEALEREASPS